MTATNDTAKASVTEIDQITGLPVEAPRTETVSTTTANPATDAAKPRRAPSTRTSRTQFWLPPLVVFLLLMGVWYIISYVILVGPTRYLMPPPHEVFYQMFFDAARRQDLIVALTRTMGVALAGLAISIVIGVGWAVIMSQAKWAERSLFPYAVILQCIPILALVPLIGFWFGFDTPSRILVAVLISLFPIVSNTLFGLQSVDKGQKELFALQGASRWVVLSKLKFPAALPSIFVGLRISAGLAVVGAIVGDQFFRRGEPGVGILIANYSSRLQGSDLFAAILAASFLGVAVFILFGWLGRLAVGKWYDFS